MEKQAKAEGSFAQPFPRGFDEHETQQILFILRNTTPLQRVNWVEEILELLRAQGKNVTVTD